jgi:hypothetical protein
VPRSASNMAGIAVTNNSSITRGLVNARYARNVERIRLGAALADRRSRMLTQITPRAASRGLLLQTMVDRGPVSPTPQGQFR